MEISTSEGLVGGILGVLYRLPYFKERSGYVSVSLVFEPEVWLGFLGCIFKERSGYVPVSLIFESEVWWIWGLDQRCGGSLRFGPDVWRIHILNQKYGRFLGFGARGVVYCPRSEKFLLLQNTGYFDGQSHSRSPSLVVSIRSRS